MADGSKQIFPKSKGKRMRAFVQGRSPFTAKGYIFEYEPDSSLWAEGSNIDAVKITPILETTGKRSYHWFSLPNDPDLLRDIAEYLEELSCEIEQDTDSLRAEHETMMERLKKN